MIKSNPRPMVDGGFKERFEEFKKTKWGVPTGLALTIVVCAAILITTWYMCFSYAIIAILAFAIPYYFGMVDLKKLAIFGLALFLILGVAFGIYMADYYKSLEGEEVWSPDNVLNNGTMASMGGDSFQYKVFLTGGNGSEEVVVIVESNWGAEIGFNETMDPWGAPDTSGQLYVKNITLTDNDLYFYGFGANLTGEEHTEGWIYTYRGTGPIRVPYTDFMMSWILSDILVVFLNIAVLFYILLGLVFWTKSSRRRYEKRQEEMDQLGLPKELPGESPIEEPSREKFVCSECGCEVPADAKECPQCGEPFVDEEEAESEEGRKCPKCGADLNEKDRKCWNCGTKLN